MSQYCRYCAFCFHGDAYYCGEREEVLSESQVKCANKCKDYIQSVLGDVDTGRKYKPRQKKEKIHEQLGLWRKEDDTDRMDSQY